MSPSLLFDELWVDSRFSVSHELADTPARSAWKSCGSEACHDLNMVRQGDEAKTLRKAADDYCTP
jgi:hypothetical protein